jgi:hypothetical protein
MQVQNRSVRYSFTAPLQVSCDLPASGGLQSEAVQACAELRREIHDVWLLCRSVVAGRKSSGACMRGGRSLRYMIHSCRPGLA